MHSRHTLLPLSSGSPGAARTQHQTAHGLATEGWFVPHTTAAALVQAHCAWSCSRSSSGTSAATRAVSADTTTHMAINLQAASDITKSVCHGHLFRLSGRQFEALEEGCCVAQPAGVQFRLLSSGCEDTSCQGKPDLSGHISSQLSSQQSSQALHSYACTVQQQQRPAVLFLHGFMGSADDWIPLMRALATTHHCVAVDLPGHGKSRLTGWPLYDFLLVAVPSLPAEADLVSTSSYTCGSARHLRSSAE